MGKRPSLPTPLEVEVALTMADRRVRWEQAQKAAGFKRVQLRVHQDDEAKLRAFSLKLLRRRGQAGD